MKELLTQKVWSIVYSENIIHRETLDEVKLNNTTRKKNLILLDAVESRLRANPSDFSKFSAVLRSDPYLRVFADILSEKHHSEINLKQVINRSLHACYIIIITVFTRY